MASAGQLVLGHSVTSSRLVLMVAGFQESTPTKHMICLIRLALRAKQCHLCHILLARAHFRASPYSQSREIDSIPLSRSCSEGQDCRQSWGRDHFSNLCSTGTGYNRCAPLAEQLGVVLVPRLCMFYIL